MNQLLKVKNLSITYNKDPEPSVRDFSMDVAPGEIVSIVGESGSGKTSVIRAVQGCLPGAGRITSGEILFEGRPLLNISAEEWRCLRGTELSMIFQDAGAMLNPIRRIGGQYVEYIRTHKDISETEAFHIAVATLKKMSLPDAERIMKSFPFQLSGGMRQRVGIAMAMTFGPKLLLADEPTSALDTTTQSQIVSQMMLLRETENTAVILVTHNLGVAAHMSDQILVMRQGRVVDRGDRETILTSPSDNYTKKLLASVPTIGGRRFV